MFWLCCFFVFQFLLKSNFSVETDVIVQGQMNGIVCVSSQIQPYLIIFTPDLIIFTPDLIIFTLVMYSQDEGACPPLLSYILTFLFLLIGTILYIMHFCCSIVEKDIQKDLNGLLCESNQVQQFPSMPKVLSHWTQKCIPRRGEAVPPSFHTFWICFSFDPKIVYYQDFVLMLFVMKNGNKEFFWKIKG